ncbi:MAG TPA: SRPBCC family protein [Candidatus Polarisedimenticolia bacterium]|nr:SRPBCC family protein [Candidatus Polarisedimenticolia bacterium]
MRVLKRILIGLVVLVALLAGVGMMLPQKVHVERSATIAAPPATVFTVLNGFVQFNKWSPWFDLDPKAQYTYEGPARGVGARMSWKGDPKKSGSGSQEIVESRPFELVKSNLDFGDQGKAVAQFALSGEAAGTKVVWSLDSDMGMGPVGRYFGLMMDSMVGKDYEKGLAKLKAFVEGMPKADFSDLKVEEVQVSPVTVAYLATSSSQEEQEIAKTIGASYGQIGKFMAARKLKQTGSPMTINTKWADSRYEFDAAIPVDRVPETEVASDSPVKIKETYSGKALKVIHTGSYHDMHGTYEKLMAYMTANGYESAGPPWDEYVSDPGNTPEPELITNIIMPIK